MIARPLTVASPRATRIARGRGGWWKVRARSSQITSHSGIFAVSGIQVRGTPRAPPPDHEGGGRDRRADDQQRQQRAHPTRAAGAGELSEDLTHAGRGGTGLRVPSGGGPGALGGAFGRKPGRRFSIGPKRTESFRI